MNRVLVVGLVIGFMVIAFNRLTPEAVRINQQMVNRCTIDMSVNPDLICD